MAEGSVTSLIRKLAEFLQNEGTLLSEVRDDAQYIADELEFMKAFLRAPEAMQDSRSPLKVFANQVSYLVYDLEDALDEFKLHLTYDNGNGFKPSLHRISHFVKTLKARHQIARKMQKMKQRAFSIYDKYKTYFDWNNTMEPGSNSTLERALSRGREPLMFGEAHPVGIERPKNKIIEWLFEDGLGRDVILVVGMGGLGKTTLVNKVYNNNKVKMHFEFRAWITLSQSSTRRDLLKDICMQLYHFLRDPQRVDSMDNDELTTVVCEFLSERRYCIVFDNVSNANTCGNVIHLLPNNKFGSRILITTRNHNVAFASFPHKIYDMNPLSQEESWDLFVGKIFHDSVCPSHLKDVLETILLRCQGNPLAIVATAAVLATKDRNIIYNWELVHRTLGTALENDVQWKNILSLSYSDLPYDLKYCLLYFSVFPVGSPIERMRLIRLWIAEGFVIAKEGMTLEEAAEEYLNELINRSLVEVVEATSDGRMKTCRVHDILLQMIVPMSDDQGFSVVARENKMVWPDKVRRLSVHENVTPTIIQKRISGSRLRSLLIFGDLDSLPESLLHLSFRRLRLLNVLDLEGTPLTKFPNEVFRLYLLKYLSLRNTKVRSIPSSIRKLKNLETLNLKHTHVTKLPSGIIKLRKLCHLLVYRYEIEPDSQIQTKYGFKVPARIGRLQPLQKLCFVEANKGKNLVQLGNLNQLRRLGIIKLRTEDGKALCASIEKMQNLHALSITALENATLDLEHLSSPPKFLQRLYLTGRVGKLPEWIASVGSLIKVVLKQSGVSVSQDPLAVLQHLPNLLHLELVQVYSGELLCFQEKGFQKLKFLGLNQLDNLNTIEIKPESMPQLENLIVQSCGSLKTVPPGIEKLSELKVLEFFNMPWMAEFHPNGEEYRRVESVPEVYFTYRHDGKWDIISLESLKQGESSTRPRLRRPRHIWK